MTLVIRDYHENHDCAESYDFDEEQYNFNINMKNFLTCNNWVATNHDQLQIALKNIEKFQPLLLEQLHYYYTIEEK